MKISSSYWFWLSMLLAMWTAAAIEGQVYDSVGLYWGGAAYFACYFLISLTSDRPILLLSLLIACLFSAAVITVAVDFAEPGYGYLLLTHLIVVGYAFHQLPLRLAITAAVAALFTVLITLSYQEIRLTPVLFILGGLAAGMVAITYR